MTFYERIQNSIYFIEKNIAEEIVLGDVAGAAFMSLGHFYRFFRAMTGYNVKEYITKRRLSRTLPLVRESGHQLLDIAVRAGFNSHEAFTRAFKREFGINPSEYRKQKRALEPIKPIILIKEVIMGILIKELPAMKVAYCQVISKSPEEAAWKKMHAWASGNGILSTPYRIFGFNNPEPKVWMEKDENGIEYPVTPDVGYGYEYWITVDDSVKPSGGIGIKTVPGGKYAVVSATQADGEDWIGKGWGKLMNMLMTSSYKMKSSGEKSRCFEEHIGFYPDPKNMRLDLYLEIE